MTTRALTKQVVGANTVRFQWTGILNGDDGQPIPPEFGDYCDRNIQISGTAGAGLAIACEGTDEYGTAVVPVGTNYNTLHDPSGNSLSFTATGLKQILEVTLFTRPNCTAGDGTTSLTVTITCRKPPFGRFVP